MSLIYIQMKATWCKSQNVVIIKPTKLFIEYQYMMIIVDLWNPDKLYVELIEKSESRFWTLRMFIAGAETRPIVMNIYLEFSWYIVHIVWAERTAEEKKKKD